MKEVNYRKSSKIRGSAVCCASERTYIYTIALIGYCFFLSLYPALSIACFAVLTISVLVHKLKPPVSGLLLSFIGLYLMFMIGCTYSENTTQAFFKLEQKALLLLCPLVLFALPKLSPFQIKSILRAYLFGCLLGVLFRLIRAYWYPELNSFFSTPFSNQLFKSHPTFAAMYVSFAFFLLLEDVVKEKAAYSRIQKYLAILALFIFYISLFYFASRMAIISFTIIAALGTGYFFFLKKKYFYALVCISLELGLVLGTLQIVPMLVPQKAATTSVSKRFEGLKKVDARKGIWESGYTIAKEQPIFGLGTGDVKDALLEEYRTRDFAVGIKHKFDAHNQYLEIVLALGLVGLLLFLASLLFPLWLAYQEKAYIYLCFLALFALLCLTDNIIEKQEGILWYAFFNSFLASQLLGKEEQVELK